jgi:hypothetical protein
MISKHCGKRLQPIGSHSDGYRLGMHVWKCAVCGRIFSQKTRKPRLKVQMAGGCTVQVTAPSEEVLKQMVCYGLTQKIKDRK